MDLIDRYGRGRLCAAGFELALFVALLVYGLWAPTLGARLLWPAVAMTPVYAVLVWFALHRPIDWSWQRPDDRLCEGELAWSRFWTGRYSLWEPALFVVFTLAIARLHYGVIADCKRRLEENLAAVASDPVLAALERVTEAGEADTFGYLLVSGPALIGAVIVPVAILGLLGFLLPR